MDYKDIKENIKLMVNDNYKDFIKALISFEKGIEDEYALEEIIDKYMDNDTLGLLNDKFDYIIDEMREEGKISDSLDVKGENDDLVNLVGSIVGDVRFITRENSNRDKFKMCNFMLNIGNEDVPEYVNCFVYGENSENTKKFKNGDLVSLIGEKSITFDHSGKELKDLRVFSSEIIKTRTQRLSVNKICKKSVMKQIEEFRDQEKNYNKKNKLQDKLTER